jgi:hypothetical protein
MVASDRTPCGALRNCSGRNSVIPRGHQAFGHVHALTPNARCSFLLWTQEQKSYIAVQAL